MTVIVADPLPTAVTSPLLLTIAMLASLDDHVRSGFAISEPPASNTDAVTVAVAPGPARTSELVYSVTEAATCATVTDAVPVAEAEVAVTVAVPSATAATRPVDETLATDNGEDAQATDAPLIVAPF